MNNTAEYSPWYLRYVMLIAFLVIVVSLMDRYVVSILMEQIKADLSLTDTQLGWLVGPAFVVVHILFQLPLARLADRTVRRNMVAIAMFLWSGFTMLAGLANSFFTLLVTRMGVGITEAGCSPPLASLLSDYFSPERRGRAMSMFSLGGVAGIGAGMMVGGIVGQEYGWRVALIAAGLPGIFLAALVFLTLREPARGGSDGVVMDSGSQPAITEVFSELARTRTFRWVVIGASLSFVTSLGRGAWEPVFLMRIYELEQAQAGMIYFLIGPLPSMLGAFAGGVLADRLGQRDARWYLWMPALATMVTCPLMIAFFLWPVADTFIFEALPVGFAFSIAGSVIGAMASPAIIATAQTLSHPSMRAMSHALWTMAANLVGMGLGPLAAGWLSDKLAPGYGVESISYSLAIVSLVAIPAALALYLGSRSVREDFARINPDSADQQIAANAG